MFCKKSAIRPILTLAMVAMLSLPGAAAAFYPRDGDFTLSSPDGPLSLSDLRGKVVLIFFGYTSCPDVCPVSLARIEACFSKLSPDELAQVRALFITLDPERDTLDRLQKYTGYFHPNIIGLREDVETIKSVTNRYGVKFSKTSTPGSGLGYSISHSTDIILLDRHGKMVESIPHDSDPAYLRGRIRDLLDVSR